MRSDVPISDPVHSVWQSLDYEVNPRDNGRGSPWAATPVTHLSKVDIHSVPAILGRVSCARASFAKLLAGAKRASE
jgi:hypothetical protein